MQSMSTENLFSRSWDLLSRNWAIIVPGLIVAIVAGILTSLLTPAVYVGDGTVVVTGYTFIRSARRGRHRRTRRDHQLQLHDRDGGGGLAHGDGDVRGRRQGVPAGGRPRPHHAMLALILVGIGAAILAPFTLGLTVLAVFFLCVYTMAAAVIGDFGGFAAIGESYRLAIARWQATAIIVVVLFVVSICAGLIGALFHLIPFIGPLVSQIIEMIVLAYFTLVVVGEYLAARTPVAVGAGQATVAAPPPYTPAPPPTRRRPRRHSI